MRRIEETTRFVPRERLALSPQCGLDSTVGGNLVTEADETAVMLAQLYTAWQRPADAARYSESRPR